MKKQLASMLLLAGLSSLHGQQTVNEAPKCAINEHEAFLRNQDANRQENVDLFYQQLLAWKSHHQVAKTSNSTFDIPVVVHVVYNPSNPQSNVSDANVMDAIDLLNKDYNRLNDDAANTPAGFLPVAGNPSIHWYLANIDPAGNSCSGIHRVPTNVSAFSTMDNVKSGATGGTNAWPTTQYFNIWVTITDLSLLGYGEFPTANVSNTFGVVVDYRVFGSLPPAQAPYNKGRVLTHEIGHCLGLKHLGLNCEDGDGLADTPIQNPGYQDCFTYPNITCNNGPNGDMFMNFMALTADACMNMFTAEQVGVMNGVLLNGPYSNLRLNQLGPVGVPDMVATKDVFLYPNPGNNEVRVRVSQVSEKGEKVVVCNALGEVVMECYVAAHESEAKLNTASFPNGVYMVRIQGEHISSSRLLSVIHN